MTRLSALCLLFCGPLVACDGAGAPAPPPSRSRVDAVLAPAGSGVSLDAFCEVQGRGGSATKMSWPELDGEVPGTSGVWTWVSLWATWCQPCLAELPMMKRWEERLQGVGHAVIVRHVSVDANAEDLASFRSSYTDPPGGPRVADQASVEPWLGSLGLDAGAAIPIHLFVDPQQRIRCVRVGAVSEPDYAAVEAILGG